MTNWGSLIIGERNKVNLLYIRISINKENLENKSKNLGKKEILEIAWMKIHKGLIQFSIKVRNLKD